MADTPATTAPQDDAPQDTTPTNEAAVQDAADVAGEDNAGDANQAAAQLENTALEDAAQGDDEKPIPNLIKEIHPADVEAEVEVTDDNTKNTPEVASTLVSATTFESLNLPEPILKALYQMKYQKPSKIQEQTLPPILAGKNVIGQAQTGSGKTACFVIGMLSKVDPRLQAVQGLCLGPTRELVLQLYNVACQMSQFMPGVTITPAIPQTSMDTVHQHLVFGTPGRLIDLLRKRKLNLSQLRVCAVDEADTMVDMQGLGDNTVRICRAIPRTCQVLLFSATFDKPHVTELAQRLVPEPRVQVMVKRRELTLDGIKQFYVFCSSTQEKFQVLDDIFGLLTIGQTLIFANKREVADALRNDLQAKKHRVTSLHGKIEPAERDRLMDDFRTGKTKVLIATNVLARGIDVLQVTLTVNFDIPMHNDKPDFDTYLHRSGRTARFGRKGVTLNLVDDNRTLAALQEISAHWGKPIEELDPSDLEENLGAALKKV